MRIKLNIVVTGQRYLTPDYQYPLSSAVYKLLGIGSPRFAEFLHDTGFHPNNKFYKLFCFGLKPERIVFENGKIKFLSPHAELFISSPLNENFVKNFIIGTLKKGSFDIFGSGIKTKFEIDTVEYVPDPEFTGIMKFLALTPLVFSTGNMEGGKLRQHYLRHDEDTNEINRVLNDNLKAKYEAVNGHPFEGEELRLAWDEEFISRQKKRKKKIEKMVRITKDPGNPVNVIGIRAPFTLEGNALLMKTGYECGFGEKNSTGFGFAMPA